MLDCTNCTRTKVEKEDFMWGADIDTKVSEVISCIPEGQFIFVEHIESGVSNWNNEAVEYFRLSGNKISNTKELDNYYKNRRARRGDFWICNIVLR